VVDGVPEVPDEDNEEDEARDPEDEIRIHQASGIST
jgi:hypothetical protein